eukprot:scaffold2043_cov166-Amphora_coffeaeformis.AAC.5
MGDSGISENEANSSTDNNKNNSNQPYEAADALSRQFQESLRISKQAPFHILCDLGYGIPKEARPRKEKILAISKQLVNFLTWQHGNARDGETTDYYPAQVEIVSCVDASAEKAITNRMHDLWKVDNGNEKFPTNISFTSSSLEEWVESHASSSSEHDPTEKQNWYSPTEVVYLSPDAEKTLDLTQPPPRVIVVGLLIDRRTIQTNKSKDRAHKLDLMAVRWPLGQIASNISPSEPLNVDCVLEGMQQWEWNWNIASDSAEATEKDRAKACTDAIVQALEHHTQRHPERPIHKNE